MASASPNISAVAHSLSRMRYEAPAPHANAALLLDVVVLGLATEDRPGVQSRVSNRELSAAGVNAPSSSSSRRRLVGARELILARRREHHERAGPGDEAAELAAAAPQPRLGVQRQIAARCPVRPLHGEAGHGATERVAALQVQRYVRAGFEPPEEGVRAADLKQRAVLDRRIVGSQGSR